VEIDGAVVFRLGAEQLSCPTPADLAALLFGSVERAGSAAGSGRLGALLARLFPLALPGYGLNYI